AAATGRLHVRPIPAVRLLGNREKRVAIGTMPVEAVTAEAERDLVDLFARVRFASPDRKQPEQHALVRHAIEVVELRRRLRVRSRKITRVGLDPGDGIEAAPVPRVAETRAFPITTIAAADRSVHHLIAANAEHP